MKQDTQESIKCRFQSPGAFADTDSFKILELSHLAGPPLSLPPLPPINDKDRRGNVNKTALLVGIFYTFSEQS